MLELMKRGQSAEDKEKAGNKADNQAGTRPTDRPGNGQCTDGC